MVRVLSSRDTNVSLFISRTGLPDRPLLTAKVLMRVRLFLNKTLGLKTFEDIDFEYLLTSRRLL